MLDGIELAQTDELIEELQKRFDHCVFAGAKNLDGKMSATNIQHNGNWLTCVGLCTYAERLITRDFAEARE